MSTIANPFASVIEGMLRGHELALHIKRAADEHQAFLTNQALHNQNMSIQDLMNTEHMQKIGALPVNQGLVTSPVTPAAGMPETVSTPLGIPGAGGAAPESQAPVLGGSYTRKARQGATWQNLKGQQFEIPTEQEQAQRDLARRISENAQLTEAGAMAQANAQQAVLNLQRQARGIPVPSEYAPFFAPGTAKVLPEELSGIQERQLDLAKRRQALEMGYNVKLSPGDVYTNVAPQVSAQPAQPGQVQGMPRAPQIALPSGAPPDSWFQSLQQLGGGSSPTAKPVTPPPAGLPATGATAAPAPGTTPTGRVLATGGVAPPTGEFGAFLRARLMKKGYTFQNAPPDLVEQATIDYAQRAKNPEDLAQARAMHALTMELTQARLDDLRAKQSTTPMPINPGTREYRIAQDLAYGKLTMPQFRSLTAYSRDTNKKMDIYDKAAELNPNFNAAQFEMGFALAKNPKVQQQLASIDNVKQGIPDLLKFSDAASRAGAPLLNKFIVPGGVALGGKKYSDFKTAQIAFADELSGALGYGSATDMSREMGFNMTNPNLSPENFTSAITNVIVPFMDRKRSTLLNQMGVYGQPGMNPAAGPAQPAAPAAPGNPNPSGYVPGHVYGGMTYLGGDPNNRASWK